MRADREKPASLRGFVLRWTSAELSDRKVAQTIKSMPLMPPRAVVMTAAAGAASFFGASATIASVVIIRPAIDAAFCSAVRVTLVGSRMPNSIMSPYLAGLRVVAVIALARGNLVQHDARLFAGVGDDLAQRRFHRALGDQDAVVLVFVVALELLDRIERTDQGNAAARDHAFLDRRTRGVQSVFDARLLSFISTSVAAPTLITATPPASLATRSCSFSRS